MSKQLYTTVCEDCGKIFKAKTNKAWFCPKCRKSRVGFASKKRNKGAEE